MTESLTHWAEGHAEVTTPKVLDTLLSISGGELEGVEVIVFLIGCDGD